MSECKYDPKDLFKELHSTSISIVMHNYTLQVIHTKQFLTLRAILCSILAYVTLGYVKV